jgi:ribosomal protein S3
MGQKVHPLGFRVGITQKHYVRWFADPGQYPQYVLEDFFLRQWITKKLPSENLPKKNEDNYSDTRLVHIFISRFLRNTIKIKIYAVNPGSFSTLFSSFPVNGQSPLNKNKITDGAERQQSKSGVSSLSSTALNANNKGSASKDYKNLSSQKFNSKFVDKKRDDTFYKELNATTFLDNDRNTKILNSPYQKYFSLLKKNSEEKVELILFLENIANKTRSKALGQNQKDNGYSLNKGSLPMEHNGTVNKVQLCITILQKIKDLRLQIHLIRRYLNKIMLGFNSFYVFENKLYKKFFFLTKVLENQILKQQKNLWFQFPNLLINYFEKTNIYGTQKFNNKKLQKGGLVRAVAPHLIQKNKSHTRINSQKNPFPSLYITKQKMEKKANLYVLNELQKSIKKISSHEGGSLDSSSERSPFNLKGKGTRIPAAFVALKSKRQSFNRFLSRFGYFNSLQKKGFAFLKYNLDLKKKSSNAQSSLDSSLDIGKIESFFLKKQKLELLIKTPKQNLLKLMSNVQFKTLSKSSESVITSKHKMFGDGVLEGQKDKGPQPDISFIAARSYPFPQLRLFQKMGASMGDGGVGTLPHATINVKNPFINSLINKQIKENAQRFPLGFKRVKKTPKNLLFVPTFQKDFGALLNKNNKYGGKTRSILNLSNLNLSNAPLPSSKKKESFFLDPEYGSSTRYLKKLNKTLFHSQFWKRQNLENIYNSTNVFEICQKMSKIQTFPKVTSLELIQVKAPIHYAACIANFVVEKLEKRFSFRGAMKKAKEAAMKKARIKGIKIKISGRLNGAEIARTEWIREGPVPLQTLKANIDYSSKTAKTIYGILGIKVWIFKGSI